MKIDITILSYFKLVNLKLCVNFDVGFTSWFAFLFPKYHLRHQIQRQSIVTPKL